MNIRRKLRDNDLFSGSRTDLGVPSQAPSRLHADFQAVGRPWRYEFPHQSSTSDPDTAPTFTVAIPENFEVPVSGATPLQASPHAVDPADQKQ